MKFTKLLMLALVTLSATVSAQDGDAGQASMVEDPIASVEIDVAAANRAKAEKRLAAKKKKRAMQSCLTLVRSYYGNEDASV